MRLIVIFAVTIAIVSVLPAVAQNRSLQTAEPDAAVPKRIVATSQIHLFDLLQLGIVPAGAEWSYTIRHLSFSEAISQELELRGMDIPDLSNMQAISNIDGSVDWERVAALAPDLVIVVDPNEARVAQTLAPTHLGFFSPNDDRDSFEILEGALLELGALVGRASEAQALISSMNDRVAAYKALAPDNRTILIISSEREGQVVMMGQQSMACRLWEGFAECADVGETAYWVNGSVEAVLSIDPDVIIIYGPCFGYDCGDRNHALVNALSEHPLWSELTAVREDRVHVAEIDVRAYSAVTVAHQFDYTAPLIYPEVFPEALSEGQITEILRR